MKTRIVIVAAAATLALAALLWWPRAAEVHAPAPLPGTTALPTAADALRGSGEACRFTTGSTFAWAYRTESHYRVNAMLPGAPGPTPQSGDVEVQGRLSFEVLSTTPGAATLVGRLTEANEPALRAVGAPLENSFLARVDERCQVTAFARLKTTPGNAARVQHLALSDLSFGVAPSAPGAEPQFFTTLGTLRAQVTQGDEGAGHWLRKPVGYVARWSPRMEGVNLKDGVLEVHRGDSAWFEQLRGEEEVAGGEVEFSRTEWSATPLTVDATALQGVSRNEADYVWGNALAELEVARTTPGGPSQDHLHRVELARDTTWDQAITRFSTLVASGANINEQWRDMAAYLDAHPDKIEEYTEEISALEFPAGAKAPAFLALGQTQSPLARDALLGVYRNPSAMSGDRIRSSLALATRSDVGAPLAKELHTAAMSKSSGPAEASVARQSVLHLGIMSGTHPTQTDVTAEALTMVQQLTATAKTPEDFSVLCGAVGNMAERSLLPQIAEWSKLPDPALRQQVPQALRRYRVADVHDLMVEWLQRETSPDVKRELFNVMHHMYVDAHEAIDAPLVAEALRHLRENPKVLTRQSLYHLLAPHLGTNAEVHAQLKQQLKYELEEKSGLYSLVAQDLPASSVLEVLSTMPALANQFAGGLKPPETPAAPQPEATPLPDLPAPAGMEAAMRGAP